MRLKFLAGFLMICTALFLGTPAMAGFSHVVTFGDSISDNGAPGYPDFYGNQIYTNGTPWADQLAAKHGAEIFNVAIGGATTGIGNLANLTAYGLLWQVDSDQTLIRDTIGGMPMNTTLFTVWAGANDYNMANYGTQYAAFTGGGGNPADFKYDTSWNSLDAGTQMYVANAAVANIMTAINTMINDMGALHILVPNIMDLTPDGYFTDTYNAQLAAELSAISGVTIYDVDMHQLFIDLFGETYDSANEDHVAAAMAAGLIWIDGYHPGPVTHDAMANAAYAATVPVPGTMLLMIFGLVTITGIRRKNPA